MVVGLGVSQNLVIICKFPQKYLFLPRGGMFFSKRSRMPWVFPAWDSPVFIVRHSGLIICKVEGFILKRAAESAVSRCTAMDVQIAAMIARIASS